MERSTADTKERSPVSHLAESSRPSLTTVSLEVTKERNEEVPFSMAIGNGELMHECSPEHSRMETARMK